MRILVDASALVPLVVERDQWHRNVTRVLGTMRAKPPVLITTNWTLYEALAIAQRYGHLRAIALFQLVSSQVRIVPVDPELEAEALRRFLSWHDKTASVVDHANLLVARDERCDAVLSFDADFVPLVASTGISVLS